MKHGTITGYRYHACRCEECKQANTKNQTRYITQRKGAIPHGTPDGYSNWGCRCQLCLQAHLARKWNQSHRRKQA